MGARGAPKIEDYNGPKKPAAGAYFMWCAENREAVMAVVRKKCEAEGKSFNITDVGRTLAERYRVECTDEQKKVFDEKSTVLKKEFAEKLAAWKETEQYAEFEKAKKVFDKKSSGKKDKKELKEAGQPNKPATGYFLFLNEHRAEVTEKLRKEHGTAFKIGMVAGASAQKWKALTEQDKIPYEKKAAEEKLKYAEQMATFKETDAYKAIEAKQEKAKKTPRARKVKDTPAGETATTTEPGVEAEA